MHVLFYYVSCSSCLSDYVPCSPVCLIMCHASAVCLIMCHARPVCLCVMLVLFVYVSCSSCLFMCSYCLFDYVPCLSCLLIVLLLNADVDSTTNPGKNCKISREVSSIHCLLVCVSFVMCLFVA